MNKKLIDLYRQMYEHTKDECAHTCRVPLSCCSPEYCRMAESIMRERGITMKHTDHPTLPFMGKDGCIVEPHNRPICTVHTCQINSFGCKPGDVAWTLKYFEIRDQIDEEEAKEHVSTRR